MRKADYAALAAIIKRERELSRAMGATKSATSYERHASAVSLALLRDVATSFSNVASVDRDAFLKACGIDP